MVNFYHQELLLLKKDNIKKIFLEHRHKKNFMAVYFTNFNTIGILFKNNTELVESKFMFFKLGFIFNTNMEFEEQFAAFL